MLPPDLEAPVEPIVLPPANVAGISLPLASRKRIDAILVMS